MSAATFTLDSPALLTLVLDLSPLAWHDASAGPATADGGSESLTLKAMLAQVLIFMNAHLAATAGNRLAVWGVKGRKSVLLFSSTEPPERERKPDPNTYEPFRAVGEAVGKRLEAFMTEEGEPGERSQDHTSSTSLVTALAKALCFINRLTQTSSIIGTAAHANSTPGAATQGGSTQAGRSNINARILVVSAGEEQSEGYVSLMNCIFSAQKARIMIDVCKVSGGDAIFLQQAAHLTGGVFLRTPHRSSLLQYLMMTFLPARQMRELVLLPSQDRVDFRAACFCHKKIIDVGYVCSVCLSIFCKPTPVCSTCKTKFPLKTLQALGAGMPRPAGGGGGARGRPSRPGSRGASPAVARVAATGGTNTAVGSPLAANEPIVIDDD